MDKDILILLSGENYSMAKAEARAVSDIAGGLPPVSLEEDIVLAICPENMNHLFHSRMGMAHRTMERKACMDMEHGLAFVEEAASALEAAVEEKTFWVRAHRLHSGPKDLDLMSICREMGRKLEGKRATPEQPDVVVEMWFGNAIHVGILIGEVDRKTAAGRKVENRPFFSPVSLHPLYARCMINLARLRARGTLYDPFCGTGGMLLEASAMGIRPMGSDVREDMVKGTLENLRHFGLDGEAFVHDIRDPLRLMADGIVTDAPYGRSTRISGQGAGELIQACLSRAEDILDAGGRLVIGTPESSSVSETDKMVLEETYRMYVHKSLTRNFSVYKKSN